MLMKQMFQYMISILLNSRSVSSQQNVVLFWTYNINEVYGCPFTFKLYESLCGLWWDFFGKYEFCYKGAWSLLCRYGLLAKMLTQSSVAWVLFLPVTGLWVIWPKLLPQGFYVQIRFGGADFLLKDLKGDERYCLLKPRKLTMSQRGFN